jgi:hypothetical protein
MSSRLDPLAVTHTTPLESAIQTCFAAGRYPVSTAFFLAKYRGYDLDKAHEAACALQPRPDITQLLAMGKNFSNHK